MDTVITNTTTKRYVCKGTCGGSVSEVEHAAGKIACMTPGCNLIGHPLVEQIETKTQQVVSKTVSEDIIINNG